jgi:hypothetical protein
MLSGQGAIPLLTAKASRWPSGAVARVDRPGNPAGCQRLAGAAGNARQEGCSGVSSQKGAVTRMP